MVDYGFCPNCGSKLQKREGRFGSFIGCPRFPKCKFSMDYKPENIGLDFSSIEKCPNCGSKLLKKEGRFGPFLSCSNYPKCRFSMNYKPKKKPNTPVSHYKITVNKRRHSFQNEKYKSKVKLTKEFVFANLDMVLEDFLNTKNWEEDVSLCMDIFDDCIMIEEEEYLDSVLGYAHHRRDKRSSMEYACDLMLGWVLEDCLVEILNELGYKTSLNGADKNRKFLLDPTTDSDLKVLVDGKEVLIESVNDFTGYWKRTKWVPLRDNKYLKLKREKSLLFGIDYKNELFILLNSSQRKAQYIQYHKPFSKPAYAILLNNNDFHNLNEVGQILSKTLSAYE